MPRLRASLIGALGVVLGLSPLASGYYSSRTWAAGGLVVVIALIAAAIAGRPRPGAAGSLAVGALAALGLWASLSRAWSPSPEGAASYGHLYLVYAALLGLLVLAMRERRDAIAALAGTAAGAGLVAVLVGGRLALGDDPASLLLGARLNEPLGYVNGQGSAFVLGTFPLLALAEQRRSAWLAGFGAGGAVLLLGLALFSQSRGVILAALVGVTAMLVVVPGRRRRAGLAVIVGGALVIAAPAIFDVYAARTTQPIPADVLRQAVRLLVVCAVSAGALWGLFVGASASLTEPVLKRFALGWSVLLAVGLVTVAGVGVVAADRIADQVDRQYETFTAVGRPAPTGGSRLTSGAGTRYDYWRVALQAWEGEPLKGVGAGGWAVSYFARRATAEDVRQPHSLPLQTLAELGVVGGLLLAAFAVAVVTGAGRRAHRARYHRDDRPVVAAGVGLFSAWLAHTSVDWIHLLPGVTGMALVGAAVLLRQPDGAQAEPPKRRGTATHRLHIVGLVLAGAVVALTALGLTRQVLADHFRAQARQALEGERPARAVKLADRSLRFQQASVGARYIKAAAFARSDEAAASELVLREAIEQEPRAFVTYVLLGDLLVRRGDLSGARRAYATASELNPRDAVLAGYARDPGEILQRARDARP